VEISNFKKIDSKLLKLGMKFTAPVFFDDGDNMFLGRGSTIKPYHIAAIERWNISFVCTMGKLAADSPEMGSGDIPVADEQEMASYMQADDLEELDDTVDLKEVPEGVA
jgi:hypothetical protein